MRIYALIVGIGLFITGLISGATLVALNLSMNPRIELFFVEEIDFNTFSGLLLASISIIFTFFGVFVAILAFFGFTSIRERVEQVAASEIEKSIQEDGKIYELTKKSVEQKVSEFVPAFTLRGVGLAESSGVDDPMEDRK